MDANFLNTIKHFLKRFQRDEQGATAVVFAILLPVIIGGLALGVESGYWFFLKTTLQNAADVSAHSVGVNMRKNASHEDLERVALKIAESSGFHSEYGKIKVNIPPEIGEYKGILNYAEVVISENHERMFSSIFSKTPVEIGARAVVAISGGTPLCYLSLSSNTRNAMQIGMLTELVGEDCGVASNSATLTSISGIFGLSNIRAACVQSSGSISGILSYAFEPCNETLTYAAPISDPYLSFEPLDTTVLPCEEFPVVKEQGRVLVSPSYVLDGTPISKFCGDQYLQGRIDFNPGVYVFERGSINITSSANIAGHDVSLFLNRSSTLQVNGATLDLSAPAIGPYKGMLLTNNRNDTVSHDISLSNSSRLAGVIYFPKSNIAIAGGRTSHCGQLIASKIFVDGNTTFNPDCAAGQKPLIAGQVVTVVE